MISNFKNEVLPQTQHSQSGPTEGKSIAIFKAIQSCNNSERGISRQELSRKFPKVSEHEMAAIIEKMSGDGHIYSTVDSDHFLACF